VFVREDYARAKEKVKKWVDDMGYIQSQLEGAYQFKTRQAFAMLKAVFGYEINWGRFVLITDNKPGSGFTRDLKPEKIGRGMIWTERDIANFVVTLQKLRAFFPGCHYEKRTGWEIEADFEKLFGDTGIDVTHDLHTVSQRVWEAVNLDYEELLRRAREEKEEGWWGYLFIGLMNPKYPDGEAMKHIVQKILYKGFETGGTNVSDNTVIKETMEAVIEGNWNF
jgi:hypothetical protein